MEHSAVHFEHRPVLRDEVIAWARAGATPPRRVVDCTVGGAGHARALLEAFPDAELLGIDRDLTAVGVATQALASFGARARVVHGRMAHMPTILADAGWASADVILADFGVSSHQLDTATRGFSFRMQGPLDMRMDPSDGVSVAEALGDLDMPALAEIIRTLGEERFAGRVARVICESKPTTTQALADVIRSVVPKGKDNIDPATRTFQALRMWINDELGEINAWLRALQHVLAPGGVALAISFHSLEDRAVKHAFRQGAHACVCPPRLPECRCGQVSWLEVLTSKPIVATSEECIANPRARSAKLRVARRLGYAVDHAE